MRRDDPRRSPKRNRSMLFTFRKGGPQSRLCTAAQMGLLTKNLAERADPEKHRSHRFDASARHERIAGLVQEYGLRRCVEELDD